MRATAVRDVEFVCPQCGVDRTGSVVDLQRWYHLWRVPLVPLATLDPMVRCDTCHHRCGLGVLTIPTAATLGRLLNDALRHAIATVIRAGHPDHAVTVDAERFAVAMMRNAGFQYDRFALHDDLVNTHDAGTAPHLRLIADELTPYGKQGLLHRLHSLAVVDGPSTVDQHAVLIRIGIALGMAAPHINGVLAVAAQHQTTRSSS